MSGKQFAANIALCAIALTAGLAIRRVPHSQPPCPTPIQQEHTAVFQVIGVKCLVQGNEQPYFTATLLSEYHTSALAGEAGAFMRLHCSNVVTVLHSVTPYGTIQSNVLEDWHDANELWSVSGSEFDESFRS